MKDAVEITAVSAVYERGGFPDVSMFASKREAEDHFVAIINENYQTEFQTYKDAEEFYDAQPDIWITVQTEEILAP